MKFPKNIITGFCLLGSALCASQTAVGSDDYIYCLGHVETDKTQTYFSSVFPGKILDRNESEFSDFIKDRYGAETWHMSCSARDDYPTAARDRERSMEALERGAVEVIATNWGSDKVASIPLQDFNIAVSSSDPQVRVCVRDHECEDGDRILVSVNGSQVFSGEIDNGWDCKDMRVTSGKNRVELYAINGTGNKGACSHADINTGEIRVEGKNSQVQSWRHRGGAGSKASIVVEVE